MMWEEALPLVLMAWGIVLLSMKLIAPAVVSSQSRRRERAVLLANNPIPPRRKPTQAELQDQRIDGLKQLFVDGELSVAELEREVGLVLMHRRESTASNDGTGEYVVMRPAP